MGAGRLARAAGAPSKGLGWRGEDVAGTPLGPNELGLARVGLQLAAQAQDLHVDAAVEHLVVMHLAGGEQLLAAQSL